MTPTRRSGGRDECACGSGVDYPRCCGRWHRGPLHLAATDPVALMRSRYCAYVLDLTDYLLATWHPSTRPAALIESGVRWLGLDVRAHRMIDATHATVEFVARSRDASGRANRLHETSRFVLESERPDEPARWFYVDGDVR